MPFKSACIFLLLLGSVSVPGRGQSLSSLEASRPEAVVTALQKAGLIPATVRLQPASAGFRVDTLRQSCISCDALFMEHLRSHTTPAQLETLLRQTPAGTSCLDEPTTAIPEAETTVFRPLMVDDLTFVLVQQRQPSGNPERPIRTTAFLVVLRDQQGILSVLEQSPQCRLRTAADHRSGTGAGCKVSK
jgi:hypothetical protein